MSWRYHLSHFHSIAILFAELRIRISSQKPPFYTHFVFRSRLVLFSHLIRFIPSHPLNEMQEISSWYKQCHRYYQQPFWMDAQITFKINSYLPGIPPAYIPFITSAFAITSSLRGFSPSPEIPFILLNYWRNVRLRQDSLYQLIQFFQTAAPPFLSDADTQNP